MNRAKTSYRNRLLSFSKIVLISVLFTLFFCSFAIAQSNSPKAQQWQSVGGQIVFSGTHDFTNFWYDGGNGMYWKNDEDKKNAPKHTVEEVNKDVMVKKGQITVRGPGFIAKFLRTKKGSVGSKLTYPSSGNNFITAHLGGQDLLHDAQGNWDWYDNNIQDFDPSKPNNGRVPAGSILTLDVWAFNNYTTGGRGYAAPKGVEYEYWFFPLEGGEVITSDKPKCEGKYLEELKKRVAKLEPGIYILCTEGDDIEVDRRGNGDFEDALDLMEKRDFIKLTENSKVITGENSKAIINFSKRGIATVKDLTTMSIARYIVSDEGITANTSMKVGEVDIEVDRRYKEIDFSVETPTCIAGVRGTEFTISHKKSPIKTTIIVHSGKVEVKPTICSAPPMTLYAGQRITVDKNCFGKLEVFETDDSNEPGTINNRQDGDITWDFETGSTNGWMKTGTAFNHQPTYGDNPTARRRGQPSKHTGNYWIGTYEKYQGYTFQTPGSIQGDGPIGTLTSNVFTIPSGSLSFLVGGGSSFQTRVELLVSGKRVLHVSGRNTETMQRVKWDLNPWAGQQGQIRIVDNASGGWGHINADDFRFSHPSSPPPPVGSGWVEPPGGGLGGDIPFGTANFNEFSLKGNIYYLQANTSRLPDFGAMSPVGSIYTKELNISNRSFTAGFPGVTNRFEWFGIRYTGTFQIQQGGQYSFRLSSDDGSKLWIDNQLIINNDGVHPNRSKSGAIYLNPGQHHIQVDYFQGPRTMVALQLFVTEPGKTEKIFSPVYSSNQTSGGLGRDITWDFETGRTNGWMKTGTAFNHQPTYGDNPTARRRGQPSKHIGNYWIGTYEKYQGYASQTPGSIQGDGPTGTLTSNVFTIPSGSLSFLVGGGSSFQTRVELLVSGKRVLHVSGRNTETMQRAKWNLNPWAGQQGQIRIVDNASGGWGHINADDFRFSHFTSPYSGPRKQDSQLR